jgi:hypothetical protein
LETKPTTFASISTSKQSVPPSGGSLEIGNICQNPYYYKLKSPLWGEKKMGKDLSLWHRLARRYGLRLLEAADIAVNGSRPWDLQVHDERLYLRCLLQGSLGFGEAYMEGWWDCEAIDEWFVVS